MESEQVSEKLQGVESDWTKADAETVGNFLWGEKPVNQEYPTNTSLERLTRTVNLLERADQISASWQLEQPTKPKTALMDLPLKRGQMFKSEYAAVAKKRAQTVSQLMIDGLVKRHLIPTTVSVNLQGRGGLRAEGKGNYSQEYLTNEEDRDQRLAPLYKTSEGGPAVYSNINAPRWRGLKEMSDMSHIRGLAHELQHAMRDLNNRGLWQDLPDEMAQYLENQGLKVQSKSVGGYKVGDRKIGMEGIGELAALIAEQKALSRQYQQKDTEPTLAQIVSELRPEIERSLRDYRKLKAKSETSISTLDNKARYLVSKHQVYEQTKALVDAGYGDGSAVNLLAALSSGYISLDKLPALIQLGIMDREKVNKVKQVWQDVLNYLTEPMPIEELPHSEKRKVVG